MVNKTPSTPAISIVMPLFNKAAQVLETIASVVAQTVNDWELVVVDDGSSDSGAELVCALGDPRIRVVRQSNAGVSAARNRGIELASVDLIAFLDADDLWLPEFLATILALQADFPIAQWFGTGYEIRPSEGGSYASRLNGPVKNFSRGILLDYFSIAIVSDPPVWTSAIAVRREAIKSIGGFPLGISSGEDLLTWARLAVRYHLAYEARPLSVFVVSGTERKPKPSDLVGKAIRHLLNEHPFAPGLRAYLGLWYRMQAVIAMHFFYDTPLARHQAFLAMFYGPGQLRNLYVLLLAFLPSAWRKILDNHVRRQLSHKKANSS